jgi:hypothetical protein
VVVWLLLAWMPAHRDHRHSVKLADHERPASVGLHDHHLDAIAQVASSGPLRCFPAAL